MEQSFLKIMMIANQVGIIVDINTLVQELMSKIICRCYLKKLAKIQDGFKWNVN